jgi:methyltransferase (TIGR00027 family)
MDGVSMTALWMAAVRARESARPDRLFDDPLAEVLAGPDGFDLMNRMEAGLGENPTLVIRPRFDEALMAAVVDREIGQVVVLAAGMDSRAYRLDLPIVFEIDRPVVLELKESRLAAVSAKPRGKRITVGVDLSREWAHELLRAGFDAEAPSIFLAEGLLGYLTEPEVHRLLDVVDRLAVPGSVLLSDVGGRSALDSPGVAFWFQRCAENGIDNARYGTDDPEGLLAAHGWNAHVHQYGDEGVNFGRWPYPPMPRDDLSLPHSYLIIGDR